MAGDKRDEGTTRDSHFARRRRAYRDAKSASGRGKTRPSSDKARPSAPDRVLLYGLHTVKAAIENPKRSIRRMLVTRNALARLNLEDPHSLSFPVEEVSPKAIDKLLAHDAVHQGVVLETKPLKPLPISALSDCRLVVVLDQITDPHNVGAILRSSVAFGAGAVIMTSRHRAQESGVLAKAASGALELISLIQVNNLAEAINELGALAFTTIGLDSDGDRRLEDAFSGQRIALVLGAEGKGLRHKTRQTVNIVARLDMPGAIPSLNVSNAAAVSLYAARSYLDL
ncbi:MAG: RNA methyltransferase [Pseudomonadota bacterium]